MIQIRAAANADEGQVDAIQHACLPAAHRYRYSQNIGVPGTANFVATDGAAVVGYISMLHSPPDLAGPYLWQRLKPYMAFVGVLPASRKHGVGARLVRQGVRSVVQEEHQLTWLECEEQVAGFYERLGYRRAAPSEVLAAVGLVPPGLVYSVSLADLR
ncbi:GNAT family N-acetyltransferase [Pseudoxanthomonas indica]|uniref:Predicted N-acetyltransferase YhbS n=1 Tax=Pseudoxanthomonas indica TaxID=428993 RepID=A0A1T5KCY4_9GAMM|nr:Predicted N-acetyltransferase YhbS [Pseudoxanthomonas indica]